MKRAWGCRQGPSPQKVKAELGSDALVISNDVKRLLNEKWLEVVTPSCNLSDYDEVLEILR